MSSLDPRYDRVRVSLKAAQEVALKQFEEGGRADLTRAEYEELAGVSRSQAAYDLAELVTLGLLERLGSGRATRYRLATSSNGRPRKWTEDRIRADLETFSGQLGRWPRASEFRETGRAGLYLAASRYGGIEHWASEFGAQTEPPSGVSARLQPLRVARVALVVGALILGVPLSVAALDFLHGRGQTEIAENPAAASGGVVREGRSAAPLITAEATKPRVTRAELTVVAALGSCWLSVRRGSEAGEVLFEGTLAGRRTVRFRGTRLWLRLGEPANLQARLNGKRLRLPGRTSTVVITKKGLRVLRTAPVAPVVVEPMLVSRTIEPSASAAPSSGPQPDPLPQPGPGPTPDPLPRKP